MRILLINDKKMVATAFASYLETHGHLIRITGSLTQTHSVITIFKPEVILLALTSPHTHEYKIFLKELKKLISPLKCFTILLTDTLSWYQLSTSIQLGIKGIIHFDDELPSIQDCITKILSKAIYLSPIITKLYPQCNNHYTNSKLTSTEIQIAKLLLSGTSTKEIAIILERSTETIKNHRKSIKQKLGIKGGKFELIKYLQERNLRD